MKEIKARYYQTHKEELKRKVKAYQQLNKERISLYRAKWGQEVKIRVLTHYGNGKLACVKCGLDDIRALSIDHINGGGTRHREEIKKSGFGLYRWLEQDGHPNGYQTLCMNCQSIKRSIRRETR